MFEETNFTVVVENPDYLCRKVIDLWVPGRPYVNPPRYFVYEMDYYYPSGTSPLRREIAPSKYIAAAVAPKAKYTIKPSKRR